MNVVKWYCFILFFLFSLMSYAQRTTIYNDSLVNYRIALELFNKEKFGNAQKLFGQVKKQLESSTFYNEIESAKFYEALSAYELFNNDAELLLNNYLELEQKNEKYYQINYYLANFLYRKKRYKDALPVFEKLSPLQVNKQWTGDYYFKKGYCYFIKTDYEKAKSNFYEIKEEESRYGNSANYYYSHIGYLQGNYQTALEGFLKLEGNDIYKYLAQYYIAQIYFMQKKYSQLNAYMPKLFNDSAAYNKEQLLELNKLQGYAFYDNKNYKQAIVYLKKYSESSSNGQSRYDDYILANSYYKIENYKPAQKLFAKICNQPDTLSQIASYLMADAHLQMSNKKEAINAFDYASKYDFDTEIKEDALFNYAKLSYELDVNPFNNAIKAFEKYLNTYPNAKRREEVNTYLTNVYLTTKNYDAAIASIQNIKNKNADLNYAYQRVTYYKAIQLYNDAKFTDAIAYFNKSDSFNYDKNVKALSTYWRGETYYQLNNFEEARTQYEDFIYLPAAIIQPVFNDAHYNIAYTYFQNKEYNEAKSWYRKFINFKNETDKSKLADAHFRLADCYFITKDAESALLNYETGLSFKKSQQDYALYQSGIIANLTKNPDKSISYFEQLRSQFPTSPYLQAANYELGNTYLNKGNSAKATEVFDAIIEKKTGSVFYKKALLKKAIIYYNESNDEKALSVYKQIVKDFPNTDESKQALIGVQNIMIEAGNAGEFANYLQTIPNANYSSGSLDSLTYLAAEKQYYKNDCNAAIVGFETYLNKFPKGLFYLKAANNKAECEFNAKKYEQALQSYAIINSSDQSKYSELALLRTARIQKFLKMCDAAYISYVKLIKQAQKIENIDEAKINAMQLSNTLNKYSENILHANDVLAIEKITEEDAQQANLQKISSTLGLKDTATAHALAIAYSNTGNSEAHTQARYIKALLFYKKRDLANAEKTAYEIINQEPAYDEWILESFLVLSDVFIQKQDYFSAKNTLKSIIDNSDKADIIKRAQERLLIVDNFEKLEELKRIAKPIQMPETREEIVDPELFNSY